jgi:hypothetical protein
MLNLSCLVYGMADEYQSRPGRANIEVDERDGSAIDIEFWRGIREETGYWHTYLKLLNW